MARISVDQISPEYYKYYTDFKNGIDGTIFRYISSLEGEIPPEILIHDNNDYSRGLNFSPIPGEYLNLSTGYYLNLQKQY